MSVICVLFCWCPGLQAERKTSSVDRLVDQVMTPATQSLLQLQSGHRSIGLALRFHVKREEGGVSKLVPMLTQLLSGRLAVLPRTSFEILPALPTSTLSNLEEASEISGHDFLLILDFSLHRGHAHLSGMLRRVHANFWSRIREPVGGVQHHFFGRMRVDATFRQLLEMPHIPLEFSWESNVVAPKATLAVASGDLDGDSRNELVWLTPNEVRVERWMGEIGLEVARIPLTGLVERPIRLRRLWGTIATVDLDGDRTDELAIWTSHHRAGGIFEVTAAGALEPFNGNSETPLCNTVDHATSSGACGPVYGTVSAQTWDESGSVFVGDVDPVRGHLSSRLRVLTPTASGRLMTLPEGIATVATGVFPQKAVGDSCEVLVTVDRSGRMRIRSVGDVITVPGVGAQVALADLNDDGVVEIVRTSNAHLGEDDELVVHSLHAHGVSVQYSAAVPPVRFLSVGDSNNDARTDVLIVSESGDVRRLNGIPAG